MSNRGPTSLCICSEPKRPVSELTKRAVSSCKILGGLFFASFGSSSLFPTVEVGIDQIDVQFYTAA